MRFIRKCKKCNVYTMKQYCPLCNQKTSEINPPNVGLEDPYQKYRIKAKLKVLKNGRNHSRCKN